MHPSTRHNAILKLLSANGTCSVSEFVRHLGVSDETVRRDIKALANQGLIERVRGGAMLPASVQEPDFQNRMSHHATEKRAIAQEAAGLIENGDSILLENGSTTLFVARALAQHRDLFVVSNGLEIARTLLNRQNNRVFLAGGAVREDDGAILGADAVAFVQRFRLRYVFITVGAIHPEGGLMNFYFDETEFAINALAQASHLVVVADHSKFRAQAPVRLCDIDRIGTLITDRRPPEPMVQRLKEAEVRLIIAPTE